ncbi:cloacin [Pseudomonas mediterranea]|jgi:hypothetical protein|uniref:colicin E3-like toxin immunity protein n=1 Tax=Pseudomonas mediterranea TaxID=183795 RepID=UPI0006D8B9EE|nr:colicin E3-like toxin immunity protein [Pseudomonas mediterranea]MDU9028618.1 colicin E3-like toxin immunity protein [Pseudomonas mediterranea]QHA83367.1 cloacin [Pseudomonas mediterranea]UZD99194.1 cloacin immunity family protein [Pseudomonas mediterranea]
MGLKLRLDWYNKKTETGEGKEYSIDLADDLSIITVLGLENEPELYDGGFDLSEEWISILQPFFGHRIDIAKYDYQIAFRYRAIW